MKVTLRKSNALQAAINEALKGLEFKSTVQLNEFQNPKAEIEGSLSKFADNVVRRENLLNALYTIRVAVSTANFRVGIDEKLAEVARLEKDISFYQPLAKAQTRVEEAVLVGKLEKIKQRDGKDNYYGHNPEEIGTSIFAEKDVETFRSKLASLKKAKQKVQDELLELNVQTSIELSDAVVEVLKKEDIV